MLQIALDAHHFCSGEDLLEMQRLGNANDIPDGVWIPVFDAILDGREVRCRVEKTAVAFADDGGLAIEQGSVGKENAECALAGGGYAALLEFRAEWGEGVVIGAFPQALVEVDVEQVVEFLKFAPREFDRLLPDSEVFGIASLEFDEFLAGGALDVFVCFFQTGDLAVEAHQLSDGVFFEILAVEEMLPAVDDLAKLRAPVADVVVGCQIMPQESCDAHQAIAQNGAPNVADMHRFCDIGRTKIDEDFFRTGGDSDT